MGASDEATLIFSTWERQTFPQRRCFLAEKDFFYQFIATAHVGEYSIFFRFKDFSVRLFARFHFMNKNVYLAMLIFCSCRSRRYGREQLFCPIKIYSNTSDEMQKHYTFNSILFPCSWNVWVLCPPLPQEECKSIQVRVFSYWRLLNDKKHSEFRVKVCIHPYFAVKLSEPFS